MAQCTASFTNKTKYLLSPGFTLVGNAPGGQGAGEWTQEPVTVHPGQTVNPLFVGVTPDDAVYIKVQYLTSTPGNYEVILEATNQPFDADIPLNNIPDTVTSATTQVPDGPDVAAIYIIQQQ